MFPDVSFRAEGRGEMTCREHLTCREQLMVRVSVAEKAKHANLLSSLLPAFVFVAVAATWLTPGALGQEYDPALYGGLQWRSIGPHRARRGNAGAGLPGPPAVFLMGKPGGGGWEKTTRGR